MNEGPDHTKQEKGMPTGSNKQQMRAAHPRPRASRAHPQLEPVSSYLSVRETAQMLGVSERSVYCYLKNGKLAGGRVGHMIVVHADSLHTFQRGAPGRIRSTPPRWHAAPEMNQQYSLTITVRLRPGQGERLRHLLSQMRQTNSHCVDGTTARYIIRNQADPDEIELILFWREMSKPSPQQRARALEALSADLADVLDWQQATVKEGLVLLYA